MNWRNITTLQWIGIIILFNTTLLGGASQLADLALSVIVVKAILALATLGNGFLGGLVTMFGGASNQIQTVTAMTTPQAQDALIKAVLAMPGVQNLDVNAKASQTLAVAAVDKDIDKIRPTPEAEQAVAAIAKSAS